MKYLSLFLLLAPCGVADTVIFRDGHTMNGSFLGGDARSIRLAVDNRVETIRVADVDRISFGNSEQSYAAPVTRDRPDDLRNGPDRPRDLRSADDAGNRPEYTRDQPEDVRNRSDDLRNRPNDSRERPDYSRDRADNDRRAAEQAPPPPTYAPPPPDRRNNYDNGPTIPSGTVLTVRMVDSVDSERDHKGQTFKASLDEPVLDPGGRMIVPRGADVVIKLVDDEQSGKIEGRTVLTLDIVSLRVNGRMVDVDTTAISQQSSSRGERSGKVIGGTAVLGAIIGGIAGGGRGAAIGAGAGAGVGTAAQVATKGQRVRVPSETRLTFTLQQPVRL